MDTFRAILVLILGGAFFFLFHRMFRVTYFGMTGLLTVGIICLLIATWLVTSVFGS